jgi:Family of unknown function (DUF5996)
MVISVSDRPVILLPSLPLASWQDTCTTLHLWTQIVGKIQLALTPSINHWWHSTFAVTPRGLTTGTIPYQHRSFEIRFDFIAHQLQIETSDGATEQIALVPQSVADFYQAVMKGLNKLDLEVAIWTMPQEMSDPIPFELDNRHAAYDRASAHRFWQILAQVNRIMSIFRSGFVGKSSPVQFFWGSFDLALSRFSGRVAPRHPDIPGMADWITQESASRELSSCGFWAGGGAVTEPAFYAYAYPQPEGYSTYPIEPPEAFYHPELGEFILPYEAVRLAVDPDAMLLTFLHSTYEAAAILGKWDRATLERT